jgi:hypothetical protein
MSRKPLTTVLAATAAAAAIGVPAAAARPVGVPSPDVQDLAARIQAAATPDLRSPDTRDFAAHRRIVASTPVKVTEFQYVTRTGFDVADAAIGGAGMLGVILLAGAGRMIVVRRRREADDLLLAS